VSKPDAEQLRLTIARLIGEDAAARDRFGVAVSGGADSLALLLLAHDAFGDRVTAASVNHRLRPEAADECAHVAALCASRGVGHVILMPDAPPQPRTQATAREVRYALLNQWAEANEIDWLLTGHHADDQLETMVMRLNRRSGVGGLAGIRARNGRVLRPLLARRRDELSAIVAVAGWQPVDDPSNSDPRFDRTTVRDALAVDTLLDPVAVAASAENLAAAETALVWASVQLYAERVRIHDSRFEFQSDDLPREFQLRIADMIMETDGHAPRGGEISALIDRLLSGQSATLGQWQVSPDQRQPGLWHFRSAPPRRKLG
jgi:tRNA(Ile)-lysidine synthase